MIFITGPLFAGKCSFAKLLLQCTEAEFEKLAIWEAQTAVLHTHSVEQLAQRLAADYQVVIVTEIGGGIVPIDPDERSYREAAGRLSCLLAAKADTVVRIFCGIPLVLKGVLPC